MRVQIDGSRGAEIISELTPQPGDRVIRKWRPSAFFRTDLEVFLGARRIDTLLCCGTSVSGCVRATVTDAFMRDIRCMVIRECVADRSEAVFEANLFDLHQKYAEVTSLSEALTCISEVLSHSDRFPLRNGNHCAEGVGARATPRVAPLTDPLACRIRNANMLKLPTHGRYRYSAIESVRPMSGPKASAWRFISG